jgi:hypothetical protein
MEIYIEFWNFLVGYLKSKSNIQSTRKRKAKSIFI